MKNQYTHYVLKYALIVAFFFVYFVLRYFIVFFTSENVTITEILQGM